MEYFKKFIYALKEIFIIYILEYIVLFGISIIYTICGGNNVKHFVINYMPYILLTFNIIVIIILYKKYYKQEKNISPKKIIPLAMIGVFSATFMNMLLFKVGGSGTSSNMSLWLVVLSTGFIGPIMEELLFRYIYLNKLLKFNDENTSIMISTFVFAILHGTLYNMIYAFVLGLILSKIYLKYKIIKASMLVHISANLIVIFLTNFDIYLLIISLIGLIISYKIEQR